ncbi:MAG: flavin reductase family protein [Candidatus Eisenbacteria bacterium]
MILEPDKMTPKDLYFLMVGSIVPRPIAFVSTISAGGAPNLAPMSFFNGVSASPPVVSVSVTRRRGAKKDTVRNALETAEFVVNVVDESIAVAMNRTSGDYPPEVNEFEVSGLTAIPSDLVAPPRVAESPIHFECRLLRAVDVGEEPSVTTLLLGQVVRFHVRDGYLKEDGHIDPDKFHAVGKMGGPLYCRTRDRFAMERPKV